jgi:hypothetical protein
MKRNVMLRTSASQPSTLSGSKAIGRTPLLFGSV